MECDTSNPVADQEPRIYKVLLIEMGLSMHSLQDGVRASCCQVRLVDVLRHRSYRAVEFLVVVTQPCLGVGVGCWQSSDVAVLLLTARVEARCRLDVGVCGCWS